MHKQPLPGDELAAAQGRRQSPILQLTTHQVQRSSRAPTPGGTTATTPTADFPGINELLATLPGESIPGGGGSLSSSTSQQQQQQQSQDHGHFFSRKKFQKPAYCHHCAEMIWGLIGQHGYMCEVCNYVAHEKCVHNIDTPCSSIAASLVKNPVSHCWSEPLFHVKRKFCNVCRKRLMDESVVIRCEVCEYYVHPDCQEFAVADCRDCATFSSRTALGQLLQYHHWREGNLAANSKCAVCRKSCWSAECLTGLRCEWCTTSVHTHCRPLIDKECNFGQLHMIMLPAGAVTIPRTELPKETILGVPAKKKESPSPRIITEEPSSGGGGGGGTGTAGGGGEKLTESSDSGGSREKSMERGGGQTSSSSHHHHHIEDDTEVVKIFDGNSSLRRKLFRAVRVPKSAPSHMVVTAALRSFHIKDDPANYYVSEAITTDTADERELPEDNPLDNALAKKEGKRPSLFLRYRNRDVDKGVIRVFPGNLKSAVPYKNIEVTRRSTVSDVIELALKRFSLDASEKNKYNLIEVTMDRGVTERQLSQDEYPLRIMQEICRESIHQMKLTRFYLQEREDPHGSQIALFIGNLPAGLSQRQYQAMLMKFIGEDNQFSSIGPIYYEYGSLVVTYDNSERAIDAFHTLSTSQFDDKSLLVMLLPSIQVHALPQDIIPLLVFVNSKSGGGQGAILISTFRKLLNPYQVFDLANGGPLPGLYVFREVAKYRILICGGDGTVGWVLQCLDNVGQDSVCSSPPCGIVPLGTGNDLARVLGWGGGYSAQENPLDILRYVTGAEEVKLDRWTVVFHPDEKPEEEASKAQALQAHAIDPTSQSEDTTQMYIMNNYFGIGIDADLALDFHNAREEAPNKFNSRLYNKKVYLKMGIRKIVGRSECKDLHEKIQLEIDGKRVDIPREIEGIIILNISSWGSGADPWGAQEREYEGGFKKPSQDDGLVEVVGVTGVAHLGQIQSGWRNGTKLAQGGHIRIRMYCDMPVHVDGEPWIQGAGQAVILRSALRASMLRRRKASSKQAKAASKHDQASSSSTFTFGQIQQEGTSSTI